MTVSLCEGPVMTVSACKGPVMTVSACEGPVMTVSLCEGPVMTVSVCEGPVMMVSACEGPVMTVSICKGPVMTVSACKGPVMTVSLCEGPVMTVSACEGPVMMVSACKGSMMTVSLCKGPVMTVSACKGPVMTVSACKGPVMTAEYAGTSQQLESLLRLKAEAEAKREEDSEAHKTRLMEDYEALEADLVRNIDRRSVLHQAVRAKQLDVVKKVLRKARVDVNSVDQDGLTSLQAAMGAQSWECAEYLIQRGATLNQSMPDGRTLLQHAMMKGGWDLAASMIRRGAHPDMPTTDPRQPLEYAAEHGGNGAFVDAIVGCLGIRIVTDFTDPTGKTVLHISAFKGNTEFLSSSLALLEPGDIATLVNKQDKTRKTALHEAARANSVEYVRMLLEAGADHRLRDMGGMTAYTMSAGGGKTRALLESWSKAKAPQ
eukprot:gene6304-7554_t